MYNLDVLREIKNFGSLVKENELFLESSKQIKREIVQEKLHNSVKFKEVLVDTLKAFILASEKHKEDVLRFLKVILKKLDSDS